MKRWIPESHLFNIIKYYINIYVLARELQNDADQNTCTGQKVYFYLYFFYVCTAFESVVCECKSSECVHKCKLVLCIVRNVISPLIFGALWNTSM